MIDRLTIDRIIGAAKIEEVVSDFVTLKKRGVNYIGLCPFHNEKTPSFIVSPAKNICKCFGCGKGGNPVNFIMEHEQLSFEEALRYLGKKYNIEIEEREQTQEEKQRHSDRESMFALNAYAQQYFSKLMFESEEGVNIGKSYFVERGFRENIIQKFQLGYSLEAKNSFSEHAIKNGFSKSFLLKTGLTIERENTLIDRFRGRVMFPIHTLSGKVVGFGGRILKKDDKTAKYVNSPESDIYHKKNELYGLFFAKQAIVRQDRCFLVEGYTDVISMFQAGIENVVASSGTSLTIEQIKLIHRFTPNITVLYDGDNAGIKASLRGIDLLLEEGMNIKVVLLPEGEDPDSFSQKQTSEEFTAFIDKNQTDFIRFKTKLLLEEAGDDPIKKASLKSDILKSISLIPDAIIRSEYIKECSKLLDVSEALLYSETNKLKTKKIEEEQKKNYIDQRNSSEDKDPAYSQPEIPEKEIALHKFQKEEENILHYLILYGELKVFNSSIEEENPVLESVAEFIIKELEIDQIKFQHPLYQELLEEAKKALDKNGTMEQYFFSHPNPELSRLAVNIGTKKYILSKIHERMRPAEAESDKLAEYVPYVVFEYKDKLIKEKIQENTKRIKAAQEANDAEAINRLWEERSVLDKIKKILAKNLRERTIY